MLSSARPRPAGATTESGAAGPACRPGGKPGCPTSASRLRGRTWTPESGSSPEQSYYADVYVFAVHTARTHSDYDPLDIGQWHFLGLSGMAGPAG
ncbi:hypothetical protein [Kitasatospora herbaricolor]|uniref:Uncharacterized protein n=1 Tax=Kitasatospora herbaricolor TaxID=68217 RepID=A0ABZ1WJ75_9ACTN|nr:hypothetical protein [Kitasatospora herbaricolor]